MLLGCLGDDFTGSSDLANTLSLKGMRVTQYCGVPQTPAAPDVDAGIVALKSRTCPVDDAVASSLAALDWLRRQGCRQFFFKYCSTFDSTRTGNIGPVIDALMDVLKADRALVCPAFPENGRTLYQGHLFVGDSLLSESGMEHHPLTPMTDPDIRRWLGYQSRRPVGHVAEETVLAGAAAISGAIDAEVAAGRPVIVVDAIRDADLMAIGEAARGLPLVTGGSGVALGLPANFRAEGALASEAAEWHGDNGPAAILSGSCSKMTRAQITRFAGDHPALEVPVDALAEGRFSEDDAIAWHDGLAAGVLPLIYTSASPQAVADAQARHGRDAIATRIETFFAEVARRLTASGVRRLVVAGGETSGAVVEGLDLPALEIGPEIAPGVPAVKAVDRPLWLALKSGNFGREDFFMDALRLLGGSDDGH